MQAAAQYFKVQRMTYSWSKLKLKVHAATFYPECVKMRALPENCNVEAYKDEWYRSKVDSECG